MSGSANICRSVVRGLTVHAEACDEEIASQTSLMCTDRSYISLAFGVYIKKLVNIQAVVKFTKYSGFYPTVLV